MDLVSASIIDDDGTAYRIASQLGDTYWEAYIGGIWQKKKEVPLGVAARAANLQSVREGHVRLPDDEKDTTLGDRVVS